MKREQRHTVHYLAARAKNGDEWSALLLQRLSDLARSGQTSGTATASVPSAEGLSAAGGTRGSSSAPVRPISPDSLGSSNLARASHQRAASPERGPRLRARATSPNPSQTKGGSQ